MKLILSLIVSLFSVVFSTGILNITLNLGGVNFNIPRIRRNAVTRVDPFDDEENIQIYENFDTNNGVIENLNLTPNKKHLPSYMNNLLKNMVYKNNNTCKTNDDGCERNSHKRERRKALTDSGLYILGNTDVADEVHKNTDNKNYEKPKNIPKKERKQAWHI